MSSEDKNKIANWKLKERIEDGLKLTSRGQTICYGQISEGVDL